VPVLLDWIRSWLLNVAPTYRIAAGSLVRITASWAPSGNWLPRPPFFINYGLTIDQWTARFRERGFPKNPWALQGVTVEVRDPAASASWLADVFALDVVHTGQVAVTVPLPGCAITFAAGAADRITAVILTGPGAPRGSVAGLRYLDAGPATSHSPA
jgi:hypothetical protein